jgi:serine/threonine protein kinase
VQVAADVAAAMAYLHPAIVHRDLKPSNVLLDASGRAKVCWQLLLLLGAAALPGSQGHDSVCRAQLPPEARGRSSSCPRCCMQVCDFGLAKLRRGTLATATATASTAGLAGTPAYMAPEIFEGRPASDKSDVFAFAVLLWECLAGRQPWEHLIPMQILYAVGVQGGRLPLPDGCPPGLAALGRECWDEAPAARPAFNEVLARLRAMQQEQAAALAAGAGAVGDGSSSGSSSGQKD